METIGSFEDLGLSAEVLKAIKDMGFEKPTLIQFKAIPPLMNGNDVLGQARTGTGKTAAFAIPIIEHHGAQHSLDALILEPTRELAVQVAKEIEHIGKHKNIRCLPVYGGASIENQIKTLKKGVDVVVGTPGRVMDHMRRETIDFSQLKMLVLDEADRMLDMGFIEDIRWIMQRIPKERQNALFSATMPPAIKELVLENMPRAVELYVSKDDLTVPDTEQVYYSVGRINKIWALTQVLDVEKPERGMIFCETKRMVSRLAEQLVKYNYPADGLHGDLSQAKREIVLKKFRKGEIKFLIATDVAARGLDVEGVTHVINYDVPDDPMTYVHRIGRTGRAGNEGKAITFITSKEKALLKSIEFLIKKPIKRAEVPERTKQHGREKARKLIDFDELCDPFGMVDFILDMGSEDGIRINDVVRAVCGKAKISETLIGDVRIGPNNTLIQIHKSAALKASRELGYLNIGNKKGRVVLKGREE
ncbi:MAG: DEAD/DEAH box helicase [Candidatus Thermoplasmatota archaeon]|nr:DEAD/DEAH box helicase [Candidatus Thermoplasmatota archaeon]